MRGFFTPLDRRRFLFSLVFLRNPCAAARSAGKGGPLLIDYFFLKDGIAFPVSLKELERKAIVNALQYFGGVPDGKEKAARAMGIGRATMYRKIKAYGFREYLR